MFVLHLCRLLWKKSRKESTVTFSSLCQLGQQIYTKANYNLLVRAFPLGQATLHHKDVHQRLFSPYWDYSISCPQGDGLSSQVTWLPSYQELLAVAVGGAGGTATPAEASTVPKGWSGEGTGNTVRPSGGKQDKTFYSSIIEFLI